MLYNEFDEILKNRLKDYPSPVHAVIWRRIRADWGRRQLFRTRSGLAGGAAVVVIAVVLGYFIVRPGRPVVGRAAAATAAVTVETSVSRPADGAAGRTTAGAVKVGSGTSHFAKSIAAKSIATGSVERTLASSTGQMSGRSRGRTLSPGGAEGAGRAADGAGVGGWKANESVAGQGQGRVGQGRAGRGRVGQGRAGQSQESGDQVSGNREAGDQVSEGRGSERQGYRGRGGLDHEGYAAMPSLAQLSSRAAIYAKPIKPSPGALARQKSRGGGSDLPGNLHLDIYGSPDIPTKQFALSYTAGARMTMLITPHFFVSAGLQYSKANVKKDSATARLYPRYFNNIDLPVLIGYTAGNDRFQFSVNGGVIFNLFSHAVGPVGWGWPNRMGTSAYLGLDFAWPLNDRLSLFAEPYGRCLFTYKSLLPSQTFTGGALIGIRYHFMRR